MSIKVRNDCNSCADGCHGCGRNANYRVVNCDCCHKDISGKLYVVDGYHYCECCTDVTDAESVLEDE